MKGHVLDVQRLQFSLPPAAAGVWLLPGGLPLGTSLFRKPGHLLDLLLLLKALELCMLVIPHISFFPLES